MLNLEFKKTVCFRLKCELLERCTGSGAWFRIPRARGEHLVLVSLFLLRCDYKKFDYLIEVDEDFQFKVKQDKGEIVKMTANELLETYKIPHDKEEKRINEETARILQKIRSARRPSSNTLKSTRL